MDEGQFPSSRTNMFTSLPIDCWMGILDYLEPEDVFSASAVSRDFYSSNLPFLYREIFWEWDAVPLTRILRLLRTVLQKPELALLADLRSHSPKLKRITIREMLWTYAPNAFAAERAKLQEDCAKAGINLQMVFDYLSPGLWTSR